MANRATQTVDALADAAWQGLLVMSRHERLRQAGVLSGHFWLACDNEPGGGSLGVAAETLHRIESVVESVPNVSDHLVAAFLCTIHAQRQRAVS